MFKENIESLNQSLKLMCRSSVANYLDAYSGKLPAFVIGWIADYPDPHNFIFTYFHSNGVYGRPQEKPILNLLKKI